MDCAVLLMDATKLLPDFGKLSQDVSGLLVHQKPARTLLPNQTKPFSEAYELEALLGSGSFADVWGCKDRATGKELACKTVFKSSLTSEERWTNLHTEIAVMSALSGRHKGLVRLKEVLEGERSVYLVMERCKGGDLYELLSKNGRLPEAAARFLVRQIASALAFCHSKGVIHRDIKPENILFDNPAKELYSMSSSDNSYPCLQTKLADFGLSVALQPGAKAAGPVGSRWYTAPELVQGKKYGRRVDIWSLGVVICTMLSGKLPFAGKTHSDDEGLRKSILRGKVNFKQPAWEGVSEEVKNLLCHMLQVEPSKRATAIDVLRHPWVSPAAQGG